MDNLDDLQTITKESTFVNHVFNFDDDTKNELLNIVQYSILVAAPVVGLNKLVKYYIPDADEEKASFDITMEVIAQIVIMFVGIFFIHRIITYIPTYSNIDYVEFNVHTIIIVAMLILSSLHTRLGKKTTILSNRLYNLWTGETSIGQSDSKPPPVQHMPNPHMPPSGSPPIQPTQSAPPITHHQEQQPFDALQQYGMSSVHPYDDDDIMPANEAMGGFDAMY